MSKPLLACTASVFLLLAQHAARAQSRAASAELRGQVSAAVALSINETHGSERAQNSGVERAQDSSGDRPRVSGDDSTRVSVVSVDAATVAVSLSGEGGGAARVSLPLRLRSNVAYCLRAAPTTAGGAVARLSIPGVRATGRFVHENALAGVRLGDAHARTRDGFATFPQDGAAHSLTLDDRPPFVLLSGPAVSKSGTFDSPDNALEITLSVEALPQSDGRSWSTRLTLSASPCR